MTILYEEADISYQIFDLQSVDEIAPVLAETFAGYDPLAVSQNLSAAEFAEGVQVLGPVAAQEGLSMIAQDKDTNDLVGVLLVHDFATVLPGLPGGEEENQEPSPIGAILGELEERYKADRTIHTGEYMNLLMIGVADGYKGRKIAQTLIKLCLENGIKRGYKLAVTKVTGPISQHVLRDKFGFIERFEIRYKEFTYQNQRPFVSIEDPPSIILMDKALIE